MKRLLALLLTICMVASFGSSYAAAENTETDTKTEATNTEPIIDEKDSNINLEPTDGIIDTNAILSALTYSTLVSWNESTMKKYNCYGYVLGKTDTFYYPGYFSGQIYDDSASVDAMAKLVAADLKSNRLNYQCVKTLPTLPSSTSGWANIIAFRKDTTYDAIDNDTNKRFNDYHFAKLSNNEWYHKPGGTAILKFKKAPSNSVAWTNEGYDGTYYSGDVTYDSNIRYILYKKSHNYTSTWTGNHYHSNGMHYFEYSNTCKGCGYKSTTWTKKSCSGPPCTLPSSIVPTPELS